jgi:hypothetical protein
MKKDWLGSFVQVVASWFEDAVNHEEYEHFLRRAVERLGRAVRSPEDQPAWAGELRLALSNLEKAGIVLNEPAGLQAEASLRLPEIEDSLEWIDRQSKRSIVVKGTVERSTASHLITLLQHSNLANEYDLKPIFKTLMRNIELKRKRGLQLRSGGNTTDRWFELHDTAILMARGACTYNDLRYLNSALKLIDWALPVHRRSVPVELLARYVLAVSEVQAALEVLV